MGTTSNLGLRLFDINDIVDVGLINQNYDKIDEKFGSLSGTRVFERSTDLEAPDPETFTDVLSFNVVGNKTYYVEGSIYCLVGIPIGIDARFNFTNGAIEDPAVSIGTWIGHFNWVSDTVRPSQIRTFPNLPNDSNVHPARLVFLIQSKEDGIVTLQARPSDATVLQIKSGSQLVVKSLG